MKNALTTFVLLLTVLSVGAQQEDTFYVPYHPDEGYGIDGDVEGFSVLSNNSVLIGGEWNQQPTGVMRWTAGTVYPDSLVSFGTGAQPQTEAFHFWSGKTYAVGFQLFQWKDQNNWTTSENEFGVNFTEGAWNDAVTIPDKYGDLGGKMLIGGTGNEMLVYGVPKDIGNILIFDGNEFTDLSDGVIYHQVRSFYVDENHLWAFMSNGKESWVELQQDSTWKSIQGDYSFPGISHVASIDKGEWCNGSFMLLGEIVDSSNNGREAILACDTTNKVCETVGTFTGSNQPSPRLFAGTCFKDSLWVQAGRYDYVVRDGEGQLLANIATYDGSVWKGIGSFPDQGSNIRTMTSNGESVFFGGNIDWVYEPDGDTVAVKNIFRWGSFAVDSTTDTSGTDTTDTTGVGVLLDRGIAFSLFPNPADNHFFIDFNEKVILERITLYDITGREQLQIPLSDTGPQTRFRVPTEGIAPGMYILRLRHDGQTQSLQVVIE